MMPQILYPIGTKRYIVFRRETIELTYGGPPYLWRDEHACVWGLPEDKTSVDWNNGCGVGFWHWRNWFPWAKKLNEECRPHDWMYSCPAWQWFHTREESDSYLKYIILIGASGDGSALLAQTFKEIARKQGAEYWENKKTNN